MCAYILGSPARTASMYANMLLDRQIYVSKDGVHEFITTALTEVLEKVKIMQRKLKFEFIPD